MKIMLKCCLENLKIDKITIFMMYYMNIAMKNNFI